MKKFPNLVYFSKKLHFFHMQYRPNCLWEAITPKQITLEVCGWTQTKDLL